MTNAVTVGGLLNHKAKVHRNTLITHGGMTGISGIMISATKFGTSTDRARVKFFSNGDLWNTLSIAMKVRNTMGVQVAETLVPEDTELITSQMAKDICLGFLRGQKKVLERWRWRWRGG
jgi:hypothetical protein